ncbi:MAG TPA: hypothetical protein VFE52_11555 [Devosia sp.]|jgi:hypothetical protein|nr:hypothetical protein [Devosia sp.]
MPQIETTYRLLSVGSAGRSRFASSRFPRPEPSAPPAARDDGGRGAQRRATPLEVLRVYDAAGRLKTPRLPPGYRMDRTA